MTDLLDAGPVLQGVRVLDVTRLLPGNYATLLLRGLGAEVIKIEELHGDGTRLAPPFTPQGESGPHLVLNRGKQSVAINLKDARGRELLLELVATSQVLLDSFRPGVLNRLGLSGPELATANPDLVHVSLNAFGSGGPLETIPAHDLNSQAMAGILAQSVDDTGRPSMPGVPVADMATGLQAALAVMAGLRAVSQRPGGYRAEVAMLDAALSLTALSSGHLAVAESRPHGRDMLTGALACYGYYQAADGHWLAVGALEPKFFGRLCELVGQPELAALQYDMARQVELRSALDEVFATADRAHWLDLLAHEDTCVTAVNDIREALAENDPLVRGVVATAQTGSGELFPVVRAVPWIPEPEPLVAPAVGADTDAVLGSLGVGLEQVDEMRRQGTVGGAS